MSRLNRFFGKPVEVEVKGTDEKGEEFKETFKLHSLKGKHMHLFMNENASPEEMEKMSHDIVFNCLLPSEPDLTIEEVAELPFSVLQDLLEAAMKANGMEKDERLEKIRQKQQAAGLVK